MHRGFLTTSAIRLAISVLLFASAMSASAQAKPLDQAIAAYDAQKYGAAFALFMPLAQAGDAKAQFYIARLYVNGLGVAKDEARAARWYELAAAQGLASAQNNLGTMYANGRGVQKDAEIAVRWFRKSAEQSNEVAQANLGDSYVDGTGVVRDLQQAREWYRKAAERGNEYSREQLAKLDAAAVPPPATVATPNPVAIAAELPVGAASGPACREVLFEPNAPVQLRSPDTALSEPYRKLGLEYCAKADAGDAEAMFQLGHVFRAAQHMKNSLTFDSISLAAVAIKWWQRAAELGHLPAQVALGAWYATPILQILEAGKPGADFSYADLYWNAAAKAGNLDAAYNLAARLFRGNGVQENQEGALSIWKHAAGLGHNESNRQIAHSYCRGEGTPMDAAEGERYLALYIKRGGPILAVENCKEFMESNWRGSVAEMGRPSYLIPAPAFVAPDSASQWTKPAKLVVPQQAAVKGAKASPEQFAAWSKQARDAARAAGVAQSYRKYLENPPSLESDSSASESREIRKLLIYLIDPAQREAAKPLRRLLEKADNDSTDKAAKVQEALKQVQIELDGDELRALLAVFGAPLPAAPSKSFQDAYKTSNPPATLERVFDRVSYSSMGTPTVKQGWALAALQYADLDLSDLFSGQSAEKAAAQITECLVVMTQ